MKKRLIIASGLVAFVFFLAWLLSEGGSESAVSISVVAVTNDAVEGPKALVRVSASSPALILDNALEPWMMKSNVFDEIEGLYGRIHGNESWSNWIHFPSNATWRLRLQVIEPEQGFSGLRERLKWSKGYRERGGWWNVLTGSKPTRYTGESYIIETEKIGPVN